MSELAIRFEEAREAHIKRGYDVAPIGVSMGDLEAIARDFKITMTETIKLYSDWRKAQVA